MSNASNAGRQARREDVKIHKNPYAKNTSNFFKWRMGWHEQDQTIKVLEPVKVFNKWSEEVG